MKQDRIEAGRITNTHGVRGELKVEVWLDSPDDLKRFPRVFIDGAEKKLLAVRTQNRFAIVTLEGVEDVNSAMCYKGKTVWIAREDANLPEGAYFLQDLIGATVITNQGETVGTLTEILERPASNVYVVTDEAGREILIPAVPAFIQHVDVDAGLVSVTLLEGMRS